MMNSIAVSRSYSYVFQAPWHYIFYCVMALVYGAVVVFFIGFMGSFMVYLSKWGVSQGTWGSREPSYLFVYAPKSFQWRDLLLQESKAEFTTPDGKPERRPMTVAGSVDHGVVTTGAEVVVIAEAASQDVGRIVTDQPIREAVPVPTDGCVPAQLEVLEVCAKGKAD